jgi:hypothetical protein
MTVIVQTDLAAALQHAHQATQVEQGVAEMTFVREQYRRGFAQTFHRHRDLPDSLRHQLALTFAQRAISSNRFLKGDDEALGQNACALDDVKGRGTHAHGNRAPLAGREGYFATFFCTCGSCSAHFLTSKEPNCESTRESLVQRKAAESATWISFFERDVVTRCGWHALGQAGMSFGGFPG